MHVFTNWIPSDCHSFVAGHCSWIQGYVGMGVFPGPRCVSQCEPVQIAWLRRTMSHSPWLQWKQGSSDCKAEENQRIRWAWTVECVYVCVWLMSPCRIREVTWHWSEQKFNLWYNYRKVTLHLDLMIIQIPSDFLVQPLGSARYRRKSQMGGSCTFDCVTQV